jgi:hypothetical protein
MASGSNPFAQARTDMRRCCVMKMLEGQVIGHAGI